MINKEQYIRLAEILDSKEHVVSFFVFLLPKGILICKNNLINFYN
jgi:hypothetical protein